MSERGSGKVILNREFFTPARLQMNRHQLGQEGAISYPTILKYLGADEVDTFSGQILYTLLVVGFGYTPEAAAELRLGEVFDLVPVTGSS